MMKNILAIVCIAMWQILSKLVTSKIVKMKTLPK